MATKFVYVLSVAASASRLGYVFWIDGEPQVWDLSRPASRSADAAYRYVREWIDYFRPQLLVTERPHSNPRKGERTHKILDAIGKAAQESNIEWQYIDRVQTYDNKYLEAQALSEQFPDLKNQLPRKRRLWEEEPRVMIIFEALGVGLG